jgi:putative nucleotidyltransferase with HDIG domain
VKEIETILASVDRVRPFPEVVTRALALLQDPEVSASRLIAVIQYDPVITARLLQVCNSALFGLCRKVESLHQAMVLLGNQGMMRLLVTFGALEYLKDEIPGYGLRKGEMWSHAVACATLSRILLMAQNQPEDHALFTGALLHDVGKIVLNEFMGAAYDEVLRQVREHHLSCLEAEQEVLGMDHARVGSILGERWNFPPNIVTIIARHHDPVDPAHDPLPLCLVHLSNLLCLQMGIGTGDQGMASRPAPGLVQALGWSPRTLDACLSELWSELETVQESMQLPKDGRG